MNMLKIIVLLTFSLLVGCELSSFEEVKNTAMLPKESKDNLVIEDDLLSRSPVASSINEFDLCLYEKKLDHTLDVGEDAIVEPSIIAQWKTDCEKT
jgi:hypothetical protein